MSKPKSFSKVLSKKFLIETLTPFLPYVGDHEEVFELKIKDDGKYVILEFIVKEVKI